jgi:hypothetical protein
MKIYHLPNSFTLYSEMSRYISNGKLATMPIKELALLYCLLTYAELRSIIERGDSFQFDVVGITPVGEVLADAHLMVHILPRNLSGEEKESENDEKDTQQDPTNYGLPTRRSSDTNKWES